MLGYAALALVIGLMCLSGTAATAGTVKVAPLPDGEEPSYDFQVKVAGQDVPVYQCRVSAMPFDRLWPGHQRPLDQTEIAAFAYWDMTGPVSVEVSSKRAVENVAVRPGGRGIKPTVEGNRISFTLDRPGAVTVEVNGYHRALHLFASPSEEAGGAAPDKNDPKVHYFGPGLHQESKIVLKSGETVYIAAGAVVHGAIQATGANDIKILGRGILDTSTFFRGRGQIVGGAVRLTDCHNILIDGVILRDSNGWVLTSQSCSDEVISNVKIIGQWRYNADGIDICNCQNVTVRDCFIRSFDDSIVVKGLHGRQRPGEAAPPEPLPVKNILAERCVIWNDWGRALEIGAETAAPEMSDITFRDCDIIRTDYAALDIQHGDRAAIRNVLYDNIRLEIDDVNERPLIQKSDDDTYKPETDYIPPLFVAEIVKTMWNRDPVQGTVENVTLRNISVTGKPFPPSRVQGLDAEHQVKNVTIENLRVNRKQIKTLEEMKMTVKPFAENVRIMSAG